MSKPRVFIGSSSEAVDIAKAIELHLTRVCETTVWDSGIFDLSKSALESLENAVNSHEFGVLVLTPDDMVTSRGKTKFGPRDNVLFELGLFVGRWGRERTFIACDPKKAKIPSDWDGITVATFDLNRALRPSETLAAVSPTCTSILHGIKSAPPAPSTENTPAISITRIAGLDELYNRIAEKSRNQSGVVISQSDTTWVWKLFPTILEWRLGRVPLTLYLSKAQGDEKRIRQEKYRRKLLENLGARLITSRRLKLEGYFLDAADENNVDALIITDDSSGYSPIAVRYHGTAHAYAARALLQSLPSSWKKDNRGYLPRLRRFQEPKVIETLRENVAQYKGAKITIIPKTVKTSELQLISRYTRAYKYRQVYYLANCYKRARIVPFRTMAVQLQDSTLSIVTPPVVEETESGLVVIEGNTRATYCHRQNIDDFFCLLVRGVTDPLPSIPCPIQDVSVTERSLSPENRMNSFDYSRFRHIERAVHPY